MTPHLQAQMYLAKASPRRSPPRASGHRLGRFRKWLIGVLKGGLTGIFTGLISGALVAFYLTPTGQASWIAIRHFSATPSCTNPLWLLQVPNSEVFASAYYERLDQIPNYRLLHVASNTIDGDLSTSWLQPWSPVTRHPGLSSSDYIEWSFAQSYRIRLICIVDGWAEDIDTYTRTLPIGTATVYSTEETVPPTSGSPSPSGECDRPQASFQDYMQQNGRVIFDYQWQPIIFDCTTSKVSGRGESHPPALAEPDLNLSTHPAPIAQPSGCAPSRQCANSRGDRRAAPASSSIARRSRLRSRLSYFRQAHRTRWSLSRRRK